MRNAGLTLLVVFGTILGMPRSVSAQFTPVGDASEYISWTASTAPEIVSSGGLFYIVLDARLKGDWKVYALDQSLPPKETVSSRPYGIDLTWSDLPNGFTPTSPLYQSEPERDHDPNFNMTLLFFHEEARVVGGMKVDDSVPDGSYDLTTSVLFQICSDSLGICLRPTTTEITSTIRIQPDCPSEDCTATPATLAALIGPAQSNGSDTPTQSSSSFVSTSANFEAFRSGGLWSFLLLAIGAGLASLLTPCVFPMIPLTVSYFSKHADNRPAAVRMAAGFGGAIIITFVAIGILASMFIGAAGAQRIASNPWVNLFIATVLVSFALSLLGMFQLRLPSSVINFMNRKGSESSGLMGVVFMGLTLTLVSFSCTAPFVGGLLAAASGGTWIYPLAGMLAYSATFALPFVLFALFPNALNSLPKSGSWMNVLKVVLGFVELAAAIKFLSNADLIWGWSLISRPLGIAFVLVTFFLTGLYLLGKLRLPHEPAVETVGVGRVLGAIGFFVIALYMLPGLMGAPLNRLDAYLPPRQGTDVGLFSLMQTGGALNPALDDERWHIDDIDAAFTEAAATGRPVLIDFSGYTCTNCREMEANVFPRKPIAERFEKNFVLLRLYTDDLEKGDEFNRFQLRLTGTVALPTYAVVDYEDRTVLAQRSGVTDVDGFAAFLDAGTAAFQSVAAKRRSEQPVAGR